MKFGSKKIARPQYGSKPVVAAYWSGTKVWQAMNDAPAYTRLTYVECNGTQWVDLDYVVQENDIIEMDYIPTYASSADKMLLAAYSAEGALWVSLYNTTAYVRFGAKSSTSVANATSRYSVRLNKGNVTFDGLEATLGYTAMPTTPLRLFSGYALDGESYSRGYCQCKKLVVSNENGSVMELIPYRRNSDGKVGMLDVVNDKFYTTAEGSEDLIAGSELNLPDGYELIDYVSFNNDRVFEACIIDSSYTIETMFRRTDSSNTVYLYGHVTSPHTASVTAYMGSSSSWRWGSGYTSMNTANTNRHYAVHKKGNLKIDVTSKTFSESTFVTDDTLIVGGYRAATGVVGTQFVGEINLFRIKDAGNYILDWTPCRSPEGEDGFWDAVSGTFIQPWKETK